MKAIHRHILMLSAVFLSASLLSGCWDQRELDELGVPFIVGYDYVKKEEKEYPEDKYLISEGLPIFYEDTVQKYHVDTSPGILVGETRGRRNSHFGEQIILGQIQVVLFGEEIASNEDITELTDTLSRNPAVKGAIPVAVAKGRAVDILKMPVKQYPNPGIYIQLLLRNIDRTNFFPTTTMFEIYRDVISNYTAPLVPYIIQKEGDIVVAGSCLLNEGKRMAHLGREETETAVFLRGIRGSGVISFDVTEDDKVIDQATFAGENSRKVKIKKGEDRYIIDILIKLSGELVERKKSQAVVDDKDFIMLSQKSLEDIIKKRAEDFVRKVQEEYGFDALNVGKEIKAHCREKHTKEAMDRVIKESEINVEVKVQIDNAGGKI
ncbi:MAG: Ger(x)C family spore germination protein [Clostridiaceae bacterium]|jgi:Ger(x)C family germination protein|nr:Ger(x)C family spore germination protein [Clostridiaceae bacterium]